MSEIAVWERVAGYSDTISAEAAMQLLRSEGMEARLVTDSAILGEARQCEIRVPEKFAHRARRLLSWPQVSDAELDYLATGRSGDADKSS